MADVLTLTDEQLASLKAQAETLEHQRALTRERSKRYYEKHRDRVLEHHKTTYAAKKAAKVNSTPAQ